MLADEVGRAAGVRGAARALLLDVDGTLAPIAPTPERAAVPPSTIGAIAELVRLGWTIVLVSGRPAAQVQVMVPVAGVHAFGSHGLEGSFRSRAVGPELPAGLLERLERMRRAATRLVDGFPGVIVERKPAGLAFHDRQLEPGRLEDWRAALADWLAKQDLLGFETIEGKRVLEVRPQGIHKGRVVRRLKSALGLGEADRSFVAVGDDVTDEDMFREIRGTGLGVRVGQANVATAAQRRLGSPDDVAEFLTALAGYGGAAP
jgi:trehalose-phosphatase